jgi:glutathione S-transferase
MMARPYVVYGQRGTGSVPVEAALLLLGEPYELKQPARAANPAAGQISADAMARINPMQQLPALILPNGELMTESAAILIHLRWGPGRPRFYQEAPRMAEVVRRVDQDPRLAEFWAERFPLVGV